jgi:hypothetical protein
VRLANGAAGEQHTQRRGDLALPAMAAKNLDARVERSVGAFRGVGRQRAGHQRRLKNALGLEQSGERERRGDLRAVQQRQPLLRGKRQRFETVFG